MQVETVVQEHAAPQRSLPVLLRATVRDVVRIMPMFSLAVIFSTVLKLYVPRDLVYSVLGKNIWVGVPLATVAGILLPIPRYATYPIALTLFQKGAPLGVVYGLIAGEVILGSLERDIMEFRYFGWKSYFLRMALCTAFVILTGYLVEVIF
jgi:uncharacterized membrane protein YraQ (UPF0718 family)